MLAIRCSATTSEKAQWIKPCINKPEFKPQDPRSGRRRLTPRDCPLTSALEYACVHI